MMCALDKVLNKCFLAKTTLYKFCIVRCLVTSIDGRLRVQGTLERDACVFSRSRARFRYGMWSVNMRYLFYFIEIYLYRVYTFSKIV